MIIKKLQAPEFDRTITLVKEYAEEVGYGEVNDDFYIDNIRAMAIDPSCVWLNAFEGNSIIGFIGGNIAEDTLSSKRMAVISYLYLLPERRQEDNLKSLMWDFMKSVESLDIGVSQIVVTANEIDEQNAILENCLSFSKKSFLARRM